MVILTNSNNILGNAIISGIKSSIEITILDADKENIHVIGFLEKFFSEHNPDTVINCMEYSDIDEAEYRREDAYNINSFIVKNISEICRDRDIFFVHFSTSYIFNGESPYVEDDIPDPASVYGDSKLMGENFLQESGCRNIIIRISDIFGPGLSFLKQRFLIRQNSGVIDVIKGQTVSPTYIKDIADAVFELIKRDAGGIFHFNQTGSVSSSDFLRKAFEIYNSYSSKNIEYNLRELDVEDFHAPGERPLFNVMDTSKYSEITGIKVRDWQEALEEFVRDNVKFFPEKMI